MWGLGVYRLRCRQQNLSAISLVWHIQASSKRADKLSKIPKRNFRSIGELSFSCIAPSAWNSLSAILRNLPTLEPELPSLDRPFHRSGWTVPVTWFGEWSQAVHWVFVLQTDLRSVGAIIINFEVTIRFGSVTINRTGCSLEQRQWRLAGLAVVWNSVSDD